MKRVSPALCAFLVMMQASGFAGGPSRATHEFQVTSSVFNEGGEIPGRYGYNFENVSPPLSWSGIPEATKSIAVICDDPDAPLGTWNHWLAYNIPPASAGLPEGMPKELRLRDGTLQGINDFRKAGYDGPAPPSGTHRYVFKVYALDADLDLPPGVTRKELLKAMAGHVLAEARLMGTFTRKGR